MELGALSAVRLQAQERETMRVAFVAFCLTCIVAITSAAVRAEDKPADKSGYSTGRQQTPEDRKSTRLNSSHLGISYAVFCLKKKKKKKKRQAHAQRNNLQTSQLTIEIK